VRRVIKKESSGNDKETVDGLSAPLMQSLEHGASMFKPATGKTAVNGKLRRADLNSSTCAQQGGTTEVTAGTRPNPSGSPVEVQEDKQGDFPASCIREVCLRIGMVSSITGLSVPTIYREISHERFPRPIKLTAGARAWRLSEIMDWIETRERDEGPGSLSSHNQSAAGGAR
jgi:predicted DNA-binding transcriptional regulator AlpA